MKFPRKTYSTPDGIERLKDALDKAESIVIGAGAGLSTSAGFTYSGERFEQYFHDFGEKYGFCDMYSGGFYPFPMPEEKWAYWSRYILITRYEDAQLPVYDNLTGIGIIDSCQHIHKSCFTASILTKKR